MKEKGLRAKILVRFFTLAVVALLINTLVSYIYTQRMVILMEKKEAARTTELIYRSLYNYMLSGNMELIQDTFTRLKKASEDIELIFITDHKHRIKRATDANLIGRSIPDKYRVKGDLVFKKEGDLIVAIRSLKNTRECVGCHTEVREGESLGVLVTSFNFGYYRGMLDSNFVILLFFSLIVVLLLVAALYYILTKDVIKKILSIAEDMAAIARGGKPSFKVKEEATELGYISGMLENIYNSVRNLFLDLTSSTKDLERLSEELKDMSLEQEKSASNITTSIHQISSTMEELSISSKKVHNQATEVAKKGEEILKISKKGDEAIERNKENMERVRELTNNLSSQVLVLNEHLKEVEGIVEMVRELSDKTDLLAINASIEAAKGGEENRGFQVVAEEIRRLADLSKSSLEKITSIIDEIENIVNKLVFSAEDELKSIDETFSLIRVSYDTMKTLVDALKEALDSFYTIDSATKEQSEAIKQVADSLSMLYKEMNKAAQSAKDLHQHSRLIADVSAKLRKFLEDSPIKVE